MSYHYVVRLDCFRCPAADTQVMLCAWDCPYPGYSILMKKFAADLRCHRCGGPLLPFRRRPADGFRTTAEEAKRVWAECEAACSPNDPRHTILEDI